MQDPPPRTPLVAALIVAAGQGTRIGGAVAKQFLPLAGQPVIRHSAAALAPHVSLIQPVGDPAAIGAALSGLPHLPPVPGGAERADSVLAGLRALAPHAPDIVLIHDAARPHIPPGTIPALLAALRNHPGAIPAVSVADTLKRADSTGRIAATVDRTGIFRAQTPQAFHFPLLLALHEARAGAATDDALLLEAASHPVALVHGSDDNIKLTIPEDFIRMERILAAALLPRTGLGYDVHAFADGRPLILCGVKVLHPRGLAGHSDADVGLHALCDAIYGALAEGDIGRHFPPTEAAWLDADSARFVTHAAGRIAARGGRLLHADLTLICERPKITPHAPSMIARVAALLGVPESRVSIKATTTERLGFTGREEGIACQAAVTLLLPDV